ncbi:unnamed protein product [Arctogadus glacialis]
MSECVVQEKGDNIITEPAESVEAGPSSAEVEQSDSEGGLMEEEDSRCKVPLLKRKQTSETCGSKAKKTADREEKEVQTESSGEETESSEEEEMEDCVTDCQPLTDSPLASASQLDGMYSVHSIQVFLKKTKSLLHGNAMMCYLIRLCSEARLLISLVFYSTLSPTPLSQARLRAPATPFVAANRAFDG